MLTIRRDQEIHREDGGWFGARWPFSFDPDGGDAVGIHQDASVHVASLAAGDEVVHRIGRGRGAYVYLIDGQARFDGQPAATGDAAKVTGQASLAVRAEAPSELILVDVAMEFERVGVWAR